MNTKSVSSTYCENILQWQKALTSNLWDKLLESENQLLTSLYRGEFPEDLLKKYQQDWKEMYSKSGIQSLISSWKKNKRHGKNRLMNPHEAQNLDEIATTFTSAIQNIFGLPKFKITPQLIEENGARAIQQEIERQVQFCQIPFPRFARKGFTFEPELKNPRQKQNRRSRSRTPSPERTSNLNTKYKKQKTSRSLSMPASTKINQPTIIPPTITTFSNCDSKQVSDFLNLTKKLNWNASDYFNVLRFLQKRDRNHNQTPHSFQLHKARYNQGSYQANTLGERGKRGKESLPSYLYQITKEACEHKDLNSIMNLFEQIQNKTYFKETKNVPTFSQKDSSWEKIKNEIAKDPNRQKCLSNYEKQLQTFFYLIQLAHLNTGLDIESVLTILALEKLVPKIQRQIYRVGRGLETGGLNYPFSNKEKIPKQRGYHAGHSYQDKISFLSYLLNQYCSQLQLINQLIFDKLLTNEQKSKLRLI